jgi:sugar lactone lactonase YvrE
MSGGLAIANNLLCLTATAAFGRVFLVDVDERRVVNCFEFRGPDGGFADAAGVAFGDDFSVYVADPRNDVVRRFTPFGKPVGTIGAPSERGPGSVTRDRPGVLDRPRAVAFAGGTLWVACGERRLRFGVQRFQPDGTALGPLRSDGDPEASFGAPRGLYADARGVLVADTLHGVVQRFDADGRFIGAFATGRDLDDVSRPIAVVALAGDEVLIADEGDRQGLRRFRVGGERLPSGPGAGELEHPAALARDARGRVYVADRDGTRVQRLQPDLRFDQTVVDLAETVHGG